MNKIILISGKMRSGKDYTAALLAQRLESFGARVGILHFGDYVKLVAEKLYHWNGEKDVNGRHLLQFIGTDVGRKNCANIWVGMLDMTISAFHDDFDFIIVPDTRFLNEADYSYCCPTYKIRVLGECPDPRDPATYHISETDLDNYEGFNKIIPNYPYLSKPQLITHLNKVIFDLGLKETL